MSTNRVEYLFDYFTLANYKSLLELALEKGFCFIVFTDNFLADRKDILWRHDVEFSPDIALKMAQIEHDLGVKATYFFQIHSEFYNIFDCYFSDILKKIKLLGHEVGLHFDAHYYGVKTENELTRFIELDKNYFEQVFDCHLSVFSFHNTNSFILKCEDYEYGGLVNVYSKYFKERFRYCADSTGYWRYEVLDELLKDSSVRHLQVLTHDAMWSTEVLSPRKRVMKSIQDNADRIKRQYDDLLPMLGAKNIDDE